MKNQFFVLWTCLAVMLTLVPTASAVYATGGTVTTNDGYIIHTFTNNGTFTALSSGNVEVVVVAGETIWKGRQ